MILKKRPVFFYTSLIDEKQRKEMREREGASD